MAEQLASLLRLNADVFRDDLDLPPGLPPTRTHDFNIFTDPNARRRPTQGPTIRLSPLLKHAIEEVRALVRELGAPSLLAAYPSGRRRVHSQWWCNGAANGVRDKREL